MDPVRACFDYCSMQRTEVQVDEQHFRRGHKHTSPPTMMIHVVSSIISSLLHTPPPVSLVALAPRCPRKENPVSTQASPWSFQFAEFSHPRRPNFQTRILRFLSDSWCLHRLCSFALFLLPKTLWELLLCLYRRTILQRQVTFKWAATCRCCISSDMIRRGSLS